MQRWIVVALCASFCIAEILASSEIHVRAKRQQCRCVRNPGGGLTCSCAKPDVTPGGTLATAEYQQKTELAHELQIAQPSQARCACLQIVFMGNPQYQCHCGDTNGNPLPTETTTTPTTTTTTPATTTTTTTTPAPTTTTHALEPIPTTVSGQGACQCIMIRISGPASAHYQCNCQNTPAPSTLAPLPSTPLPTPAPQPITSTLPEVPVYPPVGTINSTQPGCFCVEPQTQSIQPQCGCACDCVHMLCTMPMAVCACPQDQYGQPVAAHPETEAPVTLPPVTLPPTTIATEEPSTLAPAAHQPDSGYPLTTTCVMYVGVQATPCTCLPQYDQCAQNICCLKHKYRSYKQNTMFNDQPAAAEPSTIDMLMNVLQKIKNRLD